MAAYSDISQLLQILAITFFYIKNSYPGNEKLKWLAICNWSLKRRKKYFFKIIFSLPGKDCRQKVYLPVHL